MAPGITGRLRQRARFRGRRYGTACSFLNLQVFGCTPETEGNLVYAEGLWHGMVAITLPPQHPAPSMSLVKLVPRSVPWRIRIDIMPGGMKALGWKKTISSFGQFIPSIRPLYDAFTQLAATDERDPVCVIDHCGVHLGTYPEICTRNQMLLESALQGWGVCNTTTTFGDPRGDGSTACWPRQQAQALFRFIRHSPMRYRCCPSTDQVPSGAGRQPDAAHGRRMRLGSRAGFFSPEQAHRTCPWRFGSG
jgi:hypothetical protein